MALNSKGYVKPRVYLTTGIHEDGQWKTMWYVNDGHWFWTWREAIDYALTIISEQMKMSPYPGHVRFGFPFR